MPGKRIDHKNGKTWDNRRSNLRLATKNQNAWNTRKKNRGGLRKTSSKYKGVNYDKRRGYWVAELWKFGKKIFTKRFPTEKDAAIGYNVVAKKEFGEFARLNEVKVSNDDLRRIKRIILDYVRGGRKLGGGISFIKRWGENGRWIFTKRINGKGKYMGSFATREEAEVERERLKSNKEGASA